MARWRRRLCEALLFNDVFAARTIVVCSEQTEIGIEYKEAGIEVWQLPDSNESLNWKAFRKRCQELGLTGVYIESGPRLTNALISNKIIDYLFHYCASENTSDSLNMSPALSALGNDDSPYHLADSVREKHEADSLLRGWLS